MQNNNVKMVRKSFYITTDLNNKLKQEVNNISETESTILRLSLREYFERQEGKNNGKKER